MSGPQRAKPGASTADALALTGRALVGALGLDVVTACAAARAGITRPTLFEHYNAGGRAEHRGGTPLSVHAAPEITRGFAGPVRLLRLLEAGLKDLRTQQPDAPWRGVRTGVFLALPDPRRAWTGAPAIADAEQRAEFEQEAAAVEPVDVQRFGEQLLLRAQALSGVALEPMQIGVSCAGHAGVAAACIEARAALLADTLDLAVVIGLDSLLDTDTLQWFERLSRLRTADRPAGVVPGEACAVLLFETARRAARRGATSVCSLSGVRLEQDPHHILGGETSTGGVLAHAIHGLRSSHPSAATTPWLLPDHNGEIARATEWGNAIVHLVAQSAEYQASTVAYPATSFGDTGAASAAVAACMVAAAFERGYAPAAQALVCSTADGPERAVLLFEQAR